MTLNSSSPPPPPSHHKALGQLHQSIIDELGRGGRPFKKISPELIPLLIKNLALPEKRSQALCILCHGQFLPQTHDHLLWLLGEDAHNLAEDDQLFMIETLSKQIIGHYQRQGNPLPPIFITKMSAYLNNLTPRHSATIRLTIANTLLQLGAQGRIFFPMLKKLAPSKIQTLFSTLNRQLFITIKHGCR